MLEISPKSRDRLEWYIFENTGRDQWDFVLLNYYAGLFEKLNQRLLSKYGLAWMPSASGNAKILKFPHLEDYEVLGIKRFISQFQQYVVVGLNRNIESLFSDEIDFCMALDYNFKSWETMEYTEIGKLENKAKYKRSYWARRKLVTELYNALITLVNCHGHKHACLTYIPFYPEKDFCLPFKIVKALTKKMLRSCYLNEKSPIIHAELDINKAAFKDYGIRNKIEKWKQLYGRDHIKTSGLVEGQAVYIIDDLYQSGTTMWMYAAELKRLGAEYVVGLGCVKSLSDR